MSTKQQELELMMTLNCKKINEDFLDDVHVEDEVRVDVTADEEMMFEYLLRIDFKNKEVADKLNWAFC